MATAYATQGTTSKKTRPPPVASARVAKVVASSFDCFFVTKPDKATNNGARYSAHQRWTPSSRKNAATAPKSVRNATPQSGTAT